MRVNLNACGSCSVRGLGSVRAQQINRGVIAEEAFLMQPVAQILDAPTGACTNTHATDPATGHDYCFDPVNLNVAPCCTTEGASSSVSSAGLWALVALAVVGAIVFSKS